MILFNIAAVVALLYGLGYFTILTFFFGLHPQLFFLSLALGDLTLRWLIILVPDEAGGHKFRWMPALIKGSDLPQGGLQQLFLKRLLIPGFGGTLFFLPVWGYGVFLFISLIVNPALFDS